MTLVHEWLTTMTGQDGHFWVRRIQYKIEQHSTPTDDPKHDHTNTFDCFQDVVNEMVYAIEARSPVTGEPYDENMRMAACLSIITTLWYSRVQLAKIHDPKRPVASRQHAYARYQRYQHALVAALIDFADDASYFPGQQWQSPFLMDATSGDFV